jgi:hypothetical protein
MSLTWRASCPMRVAFQRARNDEPSIENRMHLDEIPRAEKAAVPAIAGSGSAKVV